jgi:hypothetical protein
MTAFAGEKTGLAFTAWYAPKTGGTPFFGACPSLFRRSLFPKKCLSPERALFGALGTQRALS